MYSRRLEPSSGTLWIFDGDDDDDGDDNRLDIVPTNKVITVKRSRKSVFHK